MSLLLLFAAAGAVGPPSLDHGRELGTDTRIGLPPVRVLGTITVATLPLVRTSAIEHARVLGDPATQGRQILLLTALEHVRDAGVPMAYTSPRPPSLDRVADGTRSIGTVEINLRVLTAPALVRA